MCAGEAYEERAWWRERKNGGGRVLVALESMRMSGGSERPLGGTENERTKGAGNEQGSRGDSERKREGSRGKRGRRAREREANDATVRGAHYDRRDRSRGSRSDEDGQRRSRRSRVRESEVAAYLCRGTRRGPKPRRMRGGRGNARLCPDKPSSVLFLTLSLARALLPLLSTSRSIRASRPFEGQDLSFSHRSAPSLSLARTAEGVRSLDRKSVV